MMVVVTKGVITKKIHVTKTARHSFGIIARYKGLVGFVGFLLPVRARFRHVILGVISTIIYSDEEFEHGPGSFSPIVKTILREGVSV